MNLPHLPKYISPQDLDITNRVLDDIRREFPVREAFDYEEKIRQIVNQRIWDVCATMQDVYKKESDYVAEIQAEQDHKYREEPVRTEE